LINKVWEKFIPDSISNVSGLVGDIAKGSVTYIKDKAFGFLKDKLDGFLSFGGGGESVSAPSGSGVGRWRSVILQAAAMMGEAVTANEVNGILKQIQRESGGNEKI